MKVGHVTEKSDDQSQALVTSLAVGRFHPFRPGSSTHKRRSSVREVVSLIPSPKNVKVSLKRDEWML